MPNQRTENLSRQLASFTRIIPISVVLALSSSGSFFVDIAAAPIARFDFNAAEFVKFATSFGSVEASNDTLERILQVGFRDALSPTASHLTAFEENRTFVYAVAELRRNADSPRITRRLIFLKPSTFVLEDQIEASTGGNVEWLLQSRPSISGRVVSLVEGENELSFETLWPEAAIRQVKSQGSNSKSTAASVLQVAPKEPSKTTRLLYILHIRHHGDERAGAKSVLASKNDEFHLTVETSQRIYKLNLPTVAAGAGEIEVSRNDGKSMLERRFFPAGVLPHGSEGVRLLELWDASYRGGKRPFWDAGKPSGELRRVVEQGIVRPGLAVDLGCGTGTDAIYLASKGFDVTAIDIAPTALSRAREKAEQASVKVRWLLASVLSPPQLSPFDFIFDRGCYHEVRFDNARAYVETVKQLSQPGRTRFLLLAGNPNEMPVQYAPPQVAEEDIRADFSSLFDFEWLQETRFETSNPAAKGPLAWSAMLRRKK